MPLKLLLDENLVSGAMLGAIAGNALAAFYPLDVASVGILPAPPKGTSDADLIAWAASQDRVMFTQDVHTLPGDLDRFVTGGNRSPGVILLRQGLSLSEIADLLYLVSYSSDASNWENTWQWLPRHNSVIARCSPSPRLSFSAIVRWPTMPPGPGDSFAPALLPSTSRRLSYR
jgi:hypothetical protein